MNSFKKGKYFFICSQINTNLVLEKDLRNEINVKVSTLVPDWAGDNNHQLWFYNSANYITNKHSHQCLHVCEEIRVELMRMYKGDKEKLVIEGSGLIGIKACEMVLTLLESDVEMRPKEEYSLMQQWTINYLPALYFFIEARSKGGLVVDVRGDDKSEGAKVILYGKKEEVADNQLWCEDDKGRLRNKLNHFLLQSNKQNEMILSADYGHDKNGWIVEERDNEGYTIVSLADSSRVMSQKQGNFLLGGPRVVSSARTSHSYLWDLRFLPHQSISINHSGSGKHFLIRNRKRGLTMEVLGECAGSHLKLVVSSLLPSEAPLKQQFSKHHFTSSLRSCIRNFAIEANENGLVTTAFDPYNKMQAWMLRGNKICNTHDHSLLIQAHPQDKEMISVGEDEDLLNQQWEFCHVPAKSFYIESLTCNKVMDVRGNNTDAGTEVVLYDRNSPPSHNQLWYEDEEGLLRSKLNGFILDTSGTDQKVRMFPYEPESVHQHWMIVGDHIENRYDNKMVVDVRGGSHFNSTPLVKYTFHGGQNQRWKFVYV